MADNQEGFKSLSKNDVLKYDFMISLEQIAMTKLLSHLWLTENIRQEILNLFHVEYAVTQEVFRNRWTQLENNVISEISTYSLPKSIIKELTIIAPIIGDYVYKWIKYHDVCVFENREYTEHSAVNLINNIKWTPRGKIDNEETAKAILASESIKLTDDNRYKLACNYCLEDEIALVAPVVLNQSYICKLNSREQPIVHFWTMHVTNEIAKINNPLYQSQNVNGISYNQHILQRLMYYNEGISVRHFNEIPIKFMWNKLTEREKAKCILPLIENLRNEDLKYSLISNLTCMQQIKVFRAHSNTILCDILEDWLWRKHFLRTAFHVLNVMKQKSYALIMIKITKVMCRDKIKHEYMYNECKYFFKMLWHKSSNYLKEFLFEGNGGVHLKTIVLSLLCEREMGMLDIIFKDLNVNHKKSIIFDKMGISQCVRLILSNDWDLLKVFIKYTISTQEDLEKLKQKLFEREGFDIAIVFIRQNKWDELKNFTDWAVKSDEKLIKFRKCLASSVIPDKVASLVGDITNLEKCVAWCSSDNPVTFNNLKAEIPKSFLEKLFMKAVRNGSYESLDEILNWCFLEDQSLIQHFKSNIYKDEKLGWSLKTWIYDKMHENNPFEIFNKFIDWAFSNPEEIAHFKQWILCPEENVSGISRELAHRRYFEKANEFYNWCTTP